jgi:hypothetical protein
MLSLLWNLSSAIRGYLRFYMPTNRAVDWLRSPRGLKWAVPTALVAVPGYLGVMAICARLALHPGLGWLNLLVLLYFWNAVKFAGLVILCIPRLLFHTVRGRHPSQVVVPVLTAGVGSHQSGGGQRA